MSCNQSQTRARINPAYYLCWFMITLCAGLYHSLDTYGPITFLAPLNEAFSKLHPDFIIHLKKNMTLLREVKVRLS